MILSRTFAILKSMKLRYSIVAGVLLYASAHIAAAQSVSLNRSLRLGMTGEDVRLLQQLLNKDPRTQIAVTGPGSPGQETTWFGSLTRAAVIRFQELYRGEVLTPAGLTNGTGLVGAFTIKKLNMLQSSSPVSAGPVLISVSPHVTTVRTPIVVSGVGFEKGPLTATIGGIAVPVSLSNDAATISLSIPSSLPLGAHAVVVTNADGASNALKVRVEDQFALTTSVSGFQISQLSPSRGGYGTVVTILGNGFAPTGNTVVFGFHTFTNVPSADGRTITLQIPQQFTGLVFRSEVLEGIDAEVPLGVMVTTNNVNSNIEQFNFTFYNN